MAKKERFITPVGIAIYPKLNTVDVYQPVDKKGRPSGAEKRRYITRLGFENQDDLAKVQAFLKKKAAELLPDVEDPKLPIKKNKKDGSLSLEATSGEKYRPAIFDAKNNKLPASVVIGGGSKLRLDVSINAYDGFGGGINLYLNAVQVLELVEGGQSKSQFEEADGFAYEGKDEDEAAEGFPSETTGEEKADYAF
jgi:hypothetical protein